MKKVVLLANDTTYTYNLRGEVLLRLIQEGYAVTIICELLQFQDELKQMGCKLVGVQTGRRGTDPVKDLQLLCSYIRILQKEKPDVVLSYNIKPNIYGGMACRLLGIHYLPNITGLGTALEYPGILQTLTSRLYKWGVWGADCIFFQNTENKQFFEKRKMFSKKTKLCLLPGSGVDLTIHHLYPYPQDEKIRFLFAARIMPEKGIDLFLAAAEKFHSENVEFHICGDCDDPRYSRILQDAEERGIVIYHGHQKSMRPYYEQCSCFLYPSYYPEGMSNVLLEAAASGRPVIAADRSGCRETVDNGISGYIVPVNDKDATLLAVEKFLNLTWEERKAMGLKGRAKVEREFDRDIVVQKYMDILNACQGAVL